MAVVGGTSRTIQHRPNRIRDYGIHLLCDGGVDIRRPNSWSGGHYLHDIDSGTWIPGHDWSCERILFPWPDCRTSHKTHRSVALSNAHVSHGILGLCIITLPYPGRPANTGGRSTRMMGRSKISEVEQVIPPNDRSTPQQQLQPQPSRRSSVDMSVLPDK